MRETFIKVLYEDRPKGEMTCLIKLEPGAPKVFEIQTIQTALRAPSGPEALQQAARLIGWLRCLHLTDGQGGVCTCP